MNTQHPEIPWLDPEHLANREKVPSEEVFQYVGQYVAWSWDGTRILAAAADRDQLWDRLLALGHDPHRVVFEYIDDVG
jgi:hypothetical protein